MKKIKSVLKTLFMTCAVFSGLFSCTDFAGENESFSSKDKAYITIKTDLKNDRSINPSEISVSDLTDFTLMYYPPDVYAENYLFQNKTFNELPSDPIEIPSGKWTFNLTAKLNGVSFGDLLESKEIKAGSNTLIFKLDAAEDLGGISITLSYKGIVDSVTAELVNLSDKSKVAEESLTQSGDGLAKTVTFKYGYKTDDTGSIDLTDFNPSTDTLKSGQYSVSIKFKATGVEESINTYENVINVIKGRVTSAEDNININDVYTITYHYNYEGSPEEKIVRYIQKSKPALETIDQTRPGYDFKGWFTSSDKGETLDTQITSIPVENTQNEVYASWEIKTYQIIYVLINGARMPNEPSPQSYTVESEDIILPIPLKDGYSFDGWYERDENNNATDNKVGTIKQGSTGEKIFDAKFQIINYSIDYRLNGGANDESNPLTFTIDDVTGDKTIILKAPSKDGFIFAGWYTSGDFSTDAVTEISSISGIDEKENKLTLYAKWNMTDIYVSGNSDGNDADGTESNPFANLSDALSVIEQQETKFTYTIYIDGQLGASSIENTITTDNAESITLQGKNGLTDDVPADKISNSTESDAQSLLISTKVPVTIKNLEIKGSERPVWFGETAFNVTLGEGCLISAPSRTGTDYALYFGSEEQSGTLILDGGKINTNGTCGGVKIDGGNFIMNNGEISGNKASLGAAVHIAGGMFTMNGGTISGNEATEKGGAVYVGYDATDKKLTGTFIMTNGTIQGNTASNSGGGVYIAGNYGTGTELTGNITFDMQGGTITGNTATSGAGVYQETSDANTGVFNMGGDAIVDNSNDVYLTGAISVTKNLTGTAPVAIITPSNYSTETAVIIRANDVNKDTFSKFAVTPQTEGTGEEAIVTNWAVSQVEDNETQGKLTYTPASQNINITFAGVTTEDIDVSRDESSNRVTFTVTEPDKYRNYTWTVDDNPQSTENGSEHILTVDFTELPDGYHVISVEANSTADTYTYSWTGEYNKSSVGGGH